MLYIAANFKTNKTRQQTAQYLGRLNNVIKQNNNNDRVYVFAPATALDEFNLDSRLVLGAQNAYPVKNGAFTGEIGEEQLDEFGIKTILIGHSERRNILGESNATIKAKFDYFKDAGYDIVFCIGEDLNTRENGKLEDFLISQLEGIDLNYGKLVVAYEPIWAIGTGVTATIEQVDKTLGFLKTKFQCPVLYGGSVKLGNVKEILSLDSCDGVLVGGASLNIEEFGQMMKIAKEC